MTGKKFAHYVVLEQAGAGAMGVVYRAHDDNLQRNVALKLPLERAVLNDAVRSKWLQEARAASALNHPNICTIYEVGEFEGQPYIAMEYLPGRPLNECIPEGGLPTETVLEYGLQIASALDHAHTHGVLHRDLKSANVRQSGTGQVKVLDFGLAVSIREKPLEDATQSSLTDHAGAPGTLAYLAPEVLTGSPAGPRADIWALGVLLFEMASRSHPFPGRTTFELCSAILKEAPRPLPMHVPPGLRAIILRCLAKQPEQRYQRASEVHAALEALHSNGGAVAVAAAARITAGSAEKHRSRKQPLLWAAAAVLVAILAALFYFAASSRFRVASPSPAGKLRRLLATQKNIVGPGLSPDGKMLAYVEQGANGDDLYLTRVAGGERMQLTHDQSRKGEPVFSPDAEKIAFARKLPGSPNEEVCTIATLGGEIVTVAQGAAMPAWSPDGTRLTFIRRTAAAAETLEIASLDGSESRTIFSADAVYPFLGRPAWSPDGKTIAVSRSRGGDSREIWLVPLNGHAPSQFTTGASGVSSDEPVFSADGRGIVFRSNRGGARNIWYQELASREAKQLTTGPGPDSTPSLARDGTLAFMNSRTRTVLLLYDLATAQTKTLLTESGILWAPVFSPDDREIAYSRGEPDGAWHLWLVNADGSAVKQLTSGRLLEIYPRYAPRGDIFYSTWGPEPLSIGLISQSGGPAHLLEPQSTASDSYADISLDGKWLVFVRTENKVSHIYVRTADGKGPAKRVGSLEGTVPRWSPDGKWIAFSPNRGFGGGAFIVHADGAGLKRIADNGGWPVWWPDGGKIGLQTVGPDGNAQFTVITLATGQSRVLPGLRFDGTNYPFDVSHDGKRLVTTNTVDESQEIWLLQGPG
ncbi:MAG TPA: protein kinase [Candidatus Eremiobacteraceae bacterium]|nr:protein kinase [Candidatus Eremiobacteraceae bacterium]